MAWRPATKIELADLWRIGETFMWRTGQTLAQRESPHKTARDVEAFPVPPHNSSRLPRHLLITAPGNPWPGLTGQNGYLIFVRAGIFAAMVDGDGKTWVGPEISRMGLPDAGNPSAA